MTEPASFSNSYMELCLHVDGDKNIYLRIPTVWDSINKNWIGFVKTPKTQTLLHASGKDSFQLLSAFNEVINKYLQAGNDLFDEIFSMFQPLSYWDEMNA